MVGIVTQASMQPLTQDFVDDGVLPNLLKPTTLQ